MTEGEKERKSVLVCERGSERVSMTERETVGEQKRERKNKRERDGESERNIDRQ